MVAHIEGIGGVFLFSTRPRRLAMWYGHVMGLPLKHLGGGVYYREVRERSVRGSKPKHPTVFAILPAEGRVSRRHNQAMVNYRVDDLERFAGQLRRHRVRVDPIEEGPDADGLGKFTHCRDPDGNRIELWQPSSRT
jgi:predicted enzyme related to lactoylglutathione lyase